MSSKERWAWPRHSTPTDRPAVERDGRDTGNKVFLLVGLTGDNTFCNGGLGCHYSLDRTIY